MRKHSKNSPTRKSSGKSARPTTSRKAAARLAVGVDLGDRYSEFCVLEDGETVHSEGRMRTTEPGGNGTEILTP